MTMVGRSKGSSLTCLRLCVVLRVKSDPDKCTDPGVYVFFNAM